MEKHPTQADGARSVTPPRAYTIGLVLPDITNPFFAFFTQGAEQIGSAYGYHIILIHSTEDLLHEREAIQALQQLDVDGAILCSPQLPTAELNLVLQHFPAVALINRELDNPLPNVVTVNVNDQRGAQAAVEALFEKGCKHIGFLSGQNNAPANQRRLDGYRRALKKAGAVFDPLMVENWMESEDIPVAVRRLLDRCPTIDGLFTFNCLAAISAIQICQERGMAIPDDMSIISAEDLPIAAIIRPQLSTLRVNLPHIGRLAMRTLLEMIEGEATAGSYQIEPELVQRESS